MSYISSLNLLGDDSPVPISEEALSEELAIWANAQFTFDTKPGSAILDDTYKEQQDLFTTFASLNEQQNNDHLLNTYLHNTHYLLPQQPQQQTQTQQQTILPRIAPAPSLNHIQQQPVQQQQSQLSVGKKRKAPPSITKHEAAEEENEPEVEEDKRKRNTAASARFRMKKKLREQALEKTAKEMTVKAEALEKRMIELEKEAKWLRALVVEKDPALLNASVNN
jgi:type IV secretory pathway VirB10-like protein